MYADLLRKQLAGQNLTQEAQVKLKNSPLRVLDITDLDIQVPDIDEALGDKSKMQFERLCDQLTAAKIKYCIDKRLVRGLDYYQDLVFEFYSTRQDRAILAGGNYDRITNCWAHPTSAIGWAAGVERIMDYHVANTINPETWVIDLDNAAHIQCQYLRTQGLSVKRYVVHPGEVKKYFAKANKYGIRLIVVIGEKEVSNNTISWKDLQTGFDYKGTVNDFVQYHSELA